MVKTQNHGNQVIRDKWQKEHPTKVVDFMPNGQRIRPNGQELGSKMAKSFVRPDILVKMDLQKWWVLGAWGAGGPFFK